MPLHLSGLVPVLLYLHDLPLLLLVLFDPAHAIKVVTHLLYLQKPLHVSSPPPGHHPLKWVQSHVDCARGHLVWVKGLIFIVILLKGRIAFIIGECIDTVGSELGIGVETLCNKLVLKVFHQLLRGRSLP